jgi:hypothetical protein
MVPSFLGSVTPPAIQALERRNCRGPQCLRIRRVVMCPPTIWSAEHGLSCITNDLCPYDRLVGSDLRRVALVSLCEFIGNHPSFVCLFSCLPAGRNGSGPCFVTAGIAVVAVKLQLKAAVCGRGEDPGATHSRRVRGWRFCYSGIMLLRYVSLA